jgi:hypothetical protein
MDGTLRQIAFVFSIKRSSAMTVINKKDGNYGVLPSEMAQIPRPILYDSEATLVVWKPPADRFASAANRFETPANCFSTPANCFASAADRFETPVGSCEPSVGDFESYVVCSESYAGGPSTAVGNAEAPVGNGKSSTVTSIRNQRSRS